MEEVPVDPTNPAAAAAAAAAVASDPLELAQQLSTQNWMLDVFLFMLASVILTAVAASYNASKDHAMSGASGWLRKLLVRLGLIEKTFTLTVEYNTIVNKWGDESAFNCSDDNRFMIKALFAYSDHLGALRSARVRVETPDDAGWDSNKFKRMKKKDLRLREIGSEVPVDSDISLSVSQSMDKGTEKTGRSTRSSVVITSRTSFKECREFARKAFEFFIESQYKRYDDEDEDKKLKYYSVRNIEHESGDITWNQYLLNTTRGFDYLYFDDKEATMKLIDNFVNRSAQFAIGGPAYKLGFLLYGVPGCGKTSFIKALANHTKRHIVDIHLSKFEKNSELRDAFFQTGLRCYDIEHNTQNLDIPLDRRIIIMEDIDALSDLVTRRSDTDTWNDKDFRKLTKKGGDEDKESKSGDEGEEENEGEDDKKKESSDSNPLTELMGGSGTADEDVKIVGGGGGGKDKDDSAIEKYLKKSERMEDRLNLAALLSILDGTLELTGPILIMTTNLPEKLDPALIRSGRITKHIYFGRMSLESLVSMMEFYFGEQVKANDVEVGESMDRGSLTNSLRGSGACMDMFSLLRSQDDDPEVSPHFRATYAPLYKLMPRFERLHRKVAPNDLEAICRNSSSLDACCSALNELLDSL